MSADDSSASAEYKNIFGVRLQHPTDMPDDMLRHCINLALKTLHGVTDWQSQGDAAVQSMKDDLDNTYGATWHVICGKHFGSKVTHDAKHFTFFYVDDKAVLIFKCG